MLEWTISRDDFKNLDILRQKMMNVVFDSYTDESSQILRDMRIAEDDNDDQSNHSESDGEADCRDDENEVMISPIRVSRATKQRVILDDDSDVNSLDYSDESDGSDERDNCEDNDNVIRKRPRSFCF